MKEMMPSVATAHQAGASLGGKRGPRAEPGLSPSCVCVCSLQVRLPGAAPQPHAPVL